MLAPMIRRASAAVLFLLVAACATTPPPADDRGAEVGVAFDREGERGSYASGLADPALGRAVTADDPVRVASVSKLLVAVGVMRLVEDGRLSLDEDASRYLDWPLRNPAFREHPVTLRMLLSHTSGLRDDADYAVPLGETVKDRLANPRAWDRGHAPGSYFTYSNLNFPVIAGIVEKVTGERFDRWMRRELLEPMKLDACFNWPTCSDAAVMRAVVLMQGGEAVRDDLHSRRPACPVVAAADGSCDLGGWRAGDNGALFSPQGGLRISARDLARVGRMLLNGGELDGVRVLSARSVAEILRPQWRFDGSNGTTEGGFYCSYGLASQQIGTRASGCNDDAAGDGVLRLGHAGEAYGLRSGLWIDPASGTGIAYFRTGLSDATRPGQSAFRAAEEAAFRRTLALLRR